MNLSERPLSTPPTPEALTKLTLGFPERWILDRLQSAIDECTTALEAWRFNDYANGSYRFFRDDLCDWYLEWAKRAFKNGGDAANVAAQVISYCFDRVLRLLHPGMPFITEYLWQQLQSTVSSTPWSEKFLMTEPWPESIHSLRSLGAGEKMSELQEIVSAVRNVRNLVSLADGVALSVTVSTLAAGTAHDLDANRDFIIDRANLSSLSISANASKPPQSVTTVVGALKVHIPLSGLVDLGKLKDQLSKREIGVEKSIAGKQARLTNADYIARAPAQQVTDTRELLAKEEIELANLKETLAGL